MHLKHIKHIIILAGCLFMLAACTNKPIDQNIKQQNNQGLELNKINANSPVDQQSANRAKHLLNKYEEIKSVRAVNLDKQLLVGVQLKHHDRFNKKDIEKKITKKNKQGQEINKINTNSPVNQQCANRAKHLINKYEEKKAVRAVNLDKKLLIGDQVKHHDRFNKNDIEKKITKDINKHF